MPLSEERQRLPHQTWTPAYAGVTSNNGGKRTYATPLQVTQITRCAAVLYSSVTTSQPPSDMNGRSSFVLSQRRLPDGVSDAAVRAAVAELSATSC